MSDWLMKALSLQNDEDIKMVELNKEDFFHALGIPLDNDMARESDGRTSPSQGEESRS